MSEPEFPHPADETAAEARRGCCCLLVGAVLGCIVGVAGTLLALA